MILVVEDGNFKKAVYAFFVAWTASYLWFLNAIPRL